MAFGDSKLPQSPTQGSGKTMFQLIVTESLLKVSDIKQLFVMLMESRDRRAWQEWLFSVPQCLVSSWYLSLLGLP